MKPLIVVAGPTASGKSKTAIELAKAIGGEIISADSMQVYKGMDIGTAKVTVEEMDGVPHYLIDALNPDEPFSIALFQGMVKEAMAIIYNKGKIPILAGGTGFYIQSIIYDITFEEVEEDHSYRHQLEQLAIEKGVDHLFAMLEEVDPASCLVIHKNNTKRVVRALEYYQQTGEPISAHNAREQQKTSSYNLGFYVLTMDRERLYQRIDQRVDLMFDQGLVGEVTELVSKGYGKDLVSMQGLGYKEVIAYLDGEYDLETAKYILKRDTRHFAKRQLTWFKREKNVVWLDQSDYDYDLDLIVKNIVKDIEVKKIL